jgi:putative flippase GtrA
MTQVSPSAWQLLRYLVVGAGTNLLALTIYYGLSLGAGVASELSLTVASGLAFLVSYVANRVWSFRFAGNSASSLVRYTIGYLGSFGVQMLILVIGVEFFGLPHQWVVLFGLGCATAAFYLLQRFWVFADGRAFGDAGSG